MRYFHLQEKNKISSIFLHISKSERVERLHSPYPSHCRLFPIISKSGRVEKLHSPFSLLTFSRQSSRLSLLTAEKSRKFFIGTFTSSILHHLELFWERQVLLPPISFFLSVYSWKKTRRPVLCPRKVGGFCFVLTIYSQVNDLVKSHPLGLDPHIWTWSIHIRIFPRLIELVVLAVAWHGYGGRICAASDHYKQITMSSSTFNHG